MLTNDVISFENPGPGWLISVFLTERLLKYRIFDFFSVRSIFISPNGHQSSIFTSGSATSENTTFGVHE